MLQIEQILQNRYKLVRSLGNNRVRQTWLARDLHLAEDVENSQVVVKLLAFGGNVQWSDLKLFEREAQILQHINHPRIPKYIDSFCIDEQTLWFGLVEKYIPGESLKEKLAKSQRFSQKQTQKIAIEVLKILIYLHELNPTVLHRDINPSNLIWGADNRIYLVDFGAVQDTAIKEATTFTIVGTYGYTPIEQFGGKAVFASDLYALGATLIHLLTGVSPAELPQHDLRMQFANLVSLSPNWIRWLQRLTEPAPEQRFVSARQALDALKFEFAFQSAKQNYPVARKEAINNSGCGINNINEPVPEEILGWNWGAFLLPWFWLWTNQVWVGLLCFLPSIGLIMVFGLGARGNELAWKSRRWRSIEHFKQHQRGWAIAALGFGAPISIILWSTAIYMIFN